MAIARLRLRAGPGAARPVRDLAGARNAGSGGCPVQIRAFLSRLRAENRPKTSFSIKWALFWQGLHDYTKGRMRHGTLTMPPRFTPR